mgnify:CR=1 FL=1
MRKSRLCWWKRALIIAVSVLLGMAFVVMPIATVVIYESIFSFRYETEEWLRFSTEDFDGLLCERSDFYSSDGTRLAGYKYSKDGQAVKGVVIVAHGLGGGGHNFYMPFIDVFVSNGYKVFAYDAHGNDESDGKSAKGLPQGVIDLDSAISHVKSLDEYASLPIVLFGHSWGAYSSASVLSMHPDVKAAVIVSGFNESEDLILHQGRQLVGVFADLTAPYVFLYERLKFGSEYADASALRGISDSNARVIVVHSEDDADVPIEYGYGKLYSELEGSERVEFIKYEDRGHSYVFCSENAHEYREALNEDYTAYVEAHGGKYNAEIKQEFMSEYLDKSKCFEPDSELMAIIIETYDQSCAGN